MTLTVDASSPAAARGAGPNTATTGVTPPGNALYVAFCQGDANNGSLDEDQTVVDSNGITWTKRVLHNGNGGACATVHYLRNTGASPGANYIATLTDNKGSVAKSIFFQVITDPATGIAPDIGAVAVSGSASVSLITTIANSWVWSCGLAANATLTAGTGCTLRDDFGGFDSGDAVFTQSQTSVTPTAGTSVTNTINGTATVPHNIAIEIIPGSAGDSAGPWTGPTPGRIGPTGQWAPQLFSADSGVTLVALADAGSSVEALAVSAAVSLADAGASAEALAVSAAAGLADAGSSAESVTVAATVPVADSAAGADTLSASATVPLADAGAAAQVLTVAATSPLADAGSAADAMVAGITIAPSDTGSAADALGVAATVPLAEAGSAAEGLAAAATAALADTGGGADALTVVVVKTLADAGAAQDALSASSTTPPVVNDNMVMPVMLGALACLQLKAPLTTNPPQVFRLASGNAFVASADFAADECCAGVAWVRFVTMYPTNNFPIQLVDVTSGPETGFAVQLELGIQRCLPTQGDDGMYGSMVTPTQWTGIVQQEMNDFMTLRKSACCLRDGYVSPVTGFPLGPRGLLLGTEQPLENSGPCGGVSLLVSVFVPSCDC